MPCPPGSYQFRENARSCLSCRARKFNPFSGAISQDMCNLCPAGTFQASSRSSKCEKCPPGMDSFDGADKCLKCGLGQAMSFLTTACNPCQSGFYGDALNARECKRCPVNHVSRNRATRVEDCRSCGAGKYVSFRRECEKCELGYFNDGSFGSCIRCPGGYETERTITGTGARKCVPCPVGTYKDLNGTEPDSSPFCKECEKGYGTNGTGNTICRRDGAACPPKTFVAKNGDCIFCAEGRRLNKRMGRCDACRAGWISPGGLSTKCTKCDYGTNEKQSECRCGIGTFLPTPNGPCTPCPAGTYRGPKNMFTVELIPTCAKCEKGTYSDREGAEKCEECPRGFVAGMEGMTKCTPCGIGLTSDARHEMCILPQTNCAPGYRRPRGSKPGALDVRCVPIRCGAGTYRDRRRDECVRCAPGTSFQTTTRTCKRCQSPRTHVSPGGTMGRCTKCPRGQVSASDRMTCRKACKRGQILRDDVCEDCPPGSYAELAGRRECILCDANTVAETAASATCAPCPQGTFSYGGGFATKCLPLPPK